MSSTQMPERGELLREREFLENLMNSRFNFMLAVYAAVIAGTLATKEAVTAYFVLAVGWTACSALAFATYRAYSVVRPIIEELKRDKTTALSWASEAARGEKFSFSANHMIGWVVPAFCSATLILAFLAVACNLWRPS
ncbi:hypothetical protein CDN99_21335 [Roseateles aquatilis]|uniref:Uncharacterized protein n=1 Tax=Roseateles aquatilis TaxID=431061 RepID=A0A246IZJ9_9BURK|nr:hypothetical protein [Roseateles aquatilis]OWQ85632.1 hypothetical protein CDN99_21335 [Roseateles aquatilis]